jgi:hypothetical protein
MNLDSMKKSNIEELITILKMTKLHLLNKNKNGNWNMIN